MKDPREITPPTLKPCPFCGEPRGRLWRSNRVQTRGWYYVQCAHCDSRGSPHPMRDGAVKAWDRRMVDGEYV
jgi:Lar family restriction alleviation protein